MERKEFLLICQKNAISGDELVTYDGIKYRPISYAIRFDKLGKACLLYTSPSPRD